MSRLRPVHQLSPAEAKMQAAVTQPPIERDFCDFAGAQRLKAKIEEYWRERGHSVEIELVESGFVAAMRAARVDLRSNMINGLPKGAA